MTQESQTASEKVENKDSVFTDKLTSNAQKVAEKLLIDIGRDMRRLASAYAKVGRSEYIDAKYIYQAREQLAPPYNYASEAEKEAQKRQKQKQKWLKHASEIMGAGILGLLLPVIFAGRVPGITIAGSAVLGGLGTLLVIFGIFYES